MEITGALEGNSLAEIQRLGGASCAIIYHRLKNGGCLVKIESATAGDLYRLSLDVQDRLGELVRDDRLTLTRDSEQIYGAARNAAGAVAHHLDEARQVLAVLGTRD